MADDNLYVIKIEQRGKPDRYYATDYNSGGYPWFPDSIGSADKITLQKARDRLKMLKDSADKGTYSEYSDGSIYPATEIAGALDMDYEHSNASGTFSIQKIVLEDTGERLVVHAQIQLPQNRVKQNQR